jgi:hypothetical protein
VLLNRIAPSSLALLACSMLCLLGLAAPSVAFANTTTINFDELEQTVPTLQITEQYAGEGVIFGDPGGFGFQYEGVEQSVDEVLPGNDEVSAYVCGIPSLLQTTKTHSDGKAAELGTCGNNEFPYHGTFVALSSTAEQVSAYVGDASTNEGMGYSGERFELDAYDSERNYLGSSKEITTTQEGIQNLISFKSGTSNIAFVAIHMFGQSDHEIGMDDFSFTLGAGAEPGLGLAFAKTTQTGVEVHDGGSAEAKLNVTRFNHSTGRVKLEISGLPPGITSATFTPVEGSTNQTTLRLTTSSSAPEESAEATVTATPLEKSAGTKPAPPLHIHVGIAPAFTFADLPPDFEISNCQPTESYAGGFLAVAEGFTNPLSLFAEAVGPGGSTGAVDAGFEPLELTPPGAPMLSLEVDPTEPVASDVETLHLEASSPGYPTQTASVPLYHTGLGVDAVSSGASIPIYAYPGSQVTIDGTGLCPAGQVHVQFGNPDAQATPTQINDYISESDTYSQSMTVTVPRLATPGPITVRTPTGSYTTSQSYAVGNLYRAGDGYSWTNHSARSKVSFEEVSNVYGYEQTHESVDPCAWLSFGLVSCKTGTTSVASPEALVFTKEIENYGSGGLCFGMNLSALRLSGLDYDPNTPALSSFTPASSKNVWQLSESGGLEQYVLEMHIVQASNEVQGARKQQQENASHQTAAGLREELLGLLSKNQPAVIDIWQGSSGHTVTAYNLQETGGGGYEIWVYNPNQPWSTKELGNSSAAAATHLEAEENSVIKVSASGEWSFAQLGWKGGFSKIDVLALSALPEHPTYKSNFIEPLVSLAASGSADLAQVTDGAGHTLIAPQGGPNTSSSRIPGATFLAPLDSRQGPNPSALVPAGGTYTLALAPSAVSHGPFVASLRGHELDGQLSGDSPPTGGSSPGGGSPPVGGGAGSTKLTLDSATSSLSFGGNSSHQALSATLLTHAGDGSQRLATLTTAGKGHYALAFDRSRDTVTVSASGASGDVSVQLGWAGHQALPGAFAAQPISLAAGETLTLTPANWATLSSRTVSAVLRTSSGRIRRVKLGRRGGLGVAVHRLKLTVKRAGSRPVLQLKASVVHARFATQATIAWAVLRGRRVIALHSASVPASALGRPHTYRTGKLAPGHYTFLGGVAITSSRNGSAALGTVTSRRRVGFAVG